jgi:hypothetical protein
MLQLLFRASRSRQHVASELEELWRVRVERGSLADADRWYRRQVLGFLLRAPRVAGLGGRTAGSLGLDALSADARGALRQLARRPAATAASVLILASALASATLVFSVVDGVVLSPLPYPDPDRLVQVTQVEPAGGAELPISPPAYLLWSQRRPRSLLGLSAAMAGGLDILDGGEPEHLVTASVGGSFFEVMAVTPALGRSFSDDEDRPTAARVVILSHALWVRRFGGDPGAIGRAVRLGGEPYEVVGVMPAGFDFPAGTEAWHPNLDVGRLGLTSRVVRGRVVGAFVLPALAGFGVGAGRSWHHHFRRGRRRLVGARILGVGAASGEEKGGQGKRGKQGSIHGRKARGKGSPLACHPSRQATNRTRRSAGKTVFSPYTSQRLTRPYLRAARAGGAAQASPPTGGRLRRGSRSAAR